MIFEPSFYFSGWATRHDLPGARTPEKCRLTNICGSRIGSGRQAGKPVRAGMDADDDAQRVDQIYCIRTDDLKRNFYSKTNLKDNGQERFKIVKA